MVLILNGARDDGRAGRAIERMWQDDFRNPLILVIPITFIIITHHNLLFYVFHLLFLQCCMGKMP